MGVTTCGCCHRLDTPVEKYIRDLSKMDICVVYTCWCQRLSGFKNMHAIIWDRVCPQSIVQIKSTFHEYIYVTYYWLMRYVAMWRRRSDRVVVHATLFGSSSLHNYFQSVSKTFLSSSIFLWFHTLNYVSRGSCTGEYGTGSDCHTGEKRHKITTRKHLYKIIVLHITIL